MIYTFGYDAAGKLVAVTDAVGNVTTIARDASENPTGITSAYGQVSTLGQIRSRLARWHNADVTCPLVTGIYLRIVAEAAEEDRLEGKTDITPYWRVVRDDGRLNPRFPGGVAAQAFRLKEEGHAIADDKVVMARPSRPAA